MIDVNPQGYARVKTAVNAVAPVAWTTTDSVARGAGHVRPSHLKDDPRSDGPLDRRGSCRPFGRGQPAPSRREPASPM